MAMRHVHATDKVFDELRAVDADLLDGLVDIHLQVQLQPLQNQTHGRQDAALAGAVPGDTSANRSLQPAIPCSDHVRHFSIWCDRPKVVMVR